MLRSKLWLVIFLILEFFVCWQLFLAADDAAKQFERQWRSREEIVYYGD